jgi:hypothetical protein
MNTTHYLYDAESQARLISNKIQKKGFPVNMFFQKGNGIKTLLKKTGRLSDFRGIFLFVPKNRKLFLVLESENVLKEIQKIVRGKRKKDKAFLREIANIYGYKSALAGRAFLKSMDAFWVEVFRKPRRLRLLKTLKSKNLVNTI